MTNYISFSFFQRKILVMEAWMAEVKNWKFACDNVPNIEAVVELVESVGLKPMDSVPVVS